MPAAKPVRKRLARLIRKHAKKFFSLESTCVQGDDVEAIHDMRVASRRAEEALRLAAQIADVKLPKALMKPIRDARNTLSRVRDLDVIIQRLREDAPGRSRAAAGLNRRVLDLLAANRKKRLNKMRRRLVKLQLGLFLSEFESSLKSKLLSAWDAKTAKQQGKQDPDAEGAACFEALLTERSGEWDSAAHRAAQTQQDADLHEARICAKRLRYLYELGEACGLGRFRARIRKVRSVQDILGHWHDLVVIEDYLLDLVADKRMLSRQLPICQHMLELIASLRRKRAGLVRRFMRRKGGVAQASAAPDAVAAPQEAPAEPATPPASVPAANPGPIPEPAHAATIDFVPTGTSAPDPTRSVDPVSADPVLPADSPTA